MEVLDYRKVKVITKNKIDKSLFNSELELLKIEIRIEKIKNKLKIN